MVRQAMVRQAMVLLYAAAWVAGAFARAAMLGEEATQPGQQLDWLRVAVKVLPRSLHFAQRCQSRLEKQAHQQARLMQSLAHHGDAARCQSVQKQAEATVAVGYLLRPCQQVAGWVLVVPALGSTLQLMAMVQVEAPMAMAQVEAPGVDIEQGNLSSCSGRLAAPRLSLELAVQLYPNGRLSHCLCCRRWSDLQS